MSRTRIAILLLTLAAEPLHASAQPAPAALHECDRLAAIPSDRDKPAGVPGVLFKVLDSAAASQACAQAVADHPTTPRFRVQLARVRQKQDRLDEAVRLSAEAAAQGYAAAQTLLANFYHAGRFVPKDQVRAAQLLGLAAAQGNRTALAVLADYHQFGLGGIAKDAREAMRLYRLAAEAGDAGAQVQLAGSYAAGRNGMAEDPAEAARLYRLAASQDHPAGQIGLAGLYLAGRGVPVDFAEAMRLLRLAAGQNEATAQHLIGFCYERGMVVGRQPDLQQAVHFYQLAARNGHAPAQDKLRQLGEDW